MNWLFLGIVIYLVFLIGTLVFIILRVVKHPDSSIVKDQPSRIISFMQNTVIHSSRIMLCVVAFNLILGLSILFWAIVTIIKGI